jgi:TetR/AcrR family transcriptional regulator
VCKPARRRYDYRITAKRSPTFDVPFPELDHSPPEHYEDMQPTRRALLSAAAEAFSLTGFDGVTVRDIERRASVNRGLVAHHFGTKEALWEATIDWMMSDMSRSLRRYWDFLGLVSTPERGRILLRVYVHFIARHPEFFRLILIEGREPSERMKMLGDRCMRPLEEMFRRATGASDDAPTAERAARHFTLFGAASVVFAVQGHAQHMFGIDPGDPDFVDLFADAVADLWVALIERREPARFDPEARPGEGAESARAGSAEAAA